MVTFQPMTSGYEIEIADDGELLVVTIGNDHGQHGVIFEHNHPDRLALAQAIAGEGYVVVPVDDLRTWCDRTFVDTLTGAWPREGTK